MSNSTLNTKKVIQHMQRLLKNEAVAAMIDNAGGVLNGAVLNQLQTILISDGSFREVTYGQISFSGNRLVLSLVVDGRSVPEFAIYS